MAARTDMRARLALRGTKFSNGRPALAGGYSTPFIGPGAILERTGGILFPYTPTISVAHQVEYSQYDVVHTNYQQNAYIKTRNPAIQVTGIFSSQTPEEAAYTVGVMHFLRVTSKMNFGMNDRDAGTPPPVLEFSAYGTYNFNRVPVLLGSFNFNYQDDVDYVEIVTGGQATQIPSMMVIAMDLLPQYSPDVQLSFNLNEFSSGVGYKRGFL
jgi:hypothetical protein